MHSGERRGKQGSEERQTVQKSEEKLLPAEEEVSASLLTLRPWRKCLILNITPIVPLNCLLLFLTLLVLFSC